MSTTTTSTESELTVSLEPHLLETLRPLSSLLPSSRAAQLNPLIADGHSSSSSTTRTIPYSLLSSISSWARSDDGERALRTHDPVLHPSDYSMIALLAGTRTSPDKRFPSVPVRSSLDDARREVNDRRAVTAIVNALLSIGGSGAATWWAAGRLAWRDEWKVLFALFVAMVVAISEAILYIIWDARRSGRPLIVRSKVSHPTERSKKVDDDTSTVTSADPEWKDAASVVTSTATPSIDENGQTVLRERNIVAGAAS